MELTAPEARSVLILKADRLCAEALRTLTQSALPKANVVLAHSIEEAEAIVARQTHDLLVTGAGASLAGDMLDFLSRHTGEGRRIRRALVVTSHLEQRTISALRAMAVHGVFDSASDRPEDYTRAVQAVAGGRRYWSASILDAFTRLWAGGNSLFRLLTTSEQMVLAVVGDGCDDERAAQLLGLSAATVSTVRRELHRKLGVQHRGELIRVAAQHGFVRFTKSGVIRPGFGLLSAAYAARRGKRGPVPHAEAQAA
jgi:DNA-binding NarL/FixJ family response regulator